MRVRNFFTSLRARFWQSQTFKTRPVVKTTESVYNPSKYFNNELFGYTSGSYNEHLRLAERYLKFDISAFINVIAATFGRDSSDIASFVKLSEGGFNRVFQTTFKDGKCVIARLPYPSTVPKHYAVASEVATLDFLRLHEIRTPEVYAWCSTEANPVGAEYIIMEKLDGTPLGDTWYSMTPKEQYKIMKQIIEWETRLMSLEIPRVWEYILSERSPVREEDPTVRAECWWYDKRSNLNIDRGPWTSSNEIFRAVGERELTWAETYAKPCHPYERLYREIHNFNQVSPDEHIKTLSDYLSLVPCLGFSADAPLNRPVIRHPDFQPNNILVSESNEIVGLIDWQHSSVLPLCLAAGIPKQFENYGDPDSEALIEPQLELPPNYDSLSQTEQASIRETSRKRLIHFLYAALTGRLNQEHYDAIFNNSAILHQRLFKSAGTPWEGDSVTLHADIIRSIRDWPNLVSPEFIADENKTCSRPPINYSDEEVQGILDLDSRQKEADVAMEQMRNVLGIDVLGWVPNNEYEAAKQTAREMKAKMLEAAETQDDIIGVRDHFPFDDFDENPWTK